MSEGFRHLDYPADTPVRNLGAAAIADLLERGDLDAWRPLAVEIRADPFGDLAEIVLRLCDAQPMYGTSALWRSWIEGLRGQPGDAVSLAELRRRRGLTQQEVGERMAISQSDVSKLERRRDLRVSTLRAFVAATGGRLELRAVHETDTTLRIE